MSPTSTSKARSRILEEVRIYAPENPREPGLLGVQSYLSDMFPTVEILTLPSPIRNARRSESERLASMFAAARVKNPDERSQSFAPMFGETEYELRVIDGDAKAGGVVYDASRLRRIFQPLLCNASLSTCHILMTDRLLSTYSEEDLRHHLRTVVLGFPSLVSIPGTVEAPARPRAYCVQKETLELMGASEIELEHLRQEFRGKFLEYGDESVGEVLKGLALQVVVYHLTLQPFCKNKRCRLFNAHWQEDLMSSQISSGSLCDAHSRQLRALARMPAIKWLMHSF